MTNESVAAPEMGPPTLPIEPELYQQTLSELQMTSICLDEVSSLCHREDFSASDIILTVNVSAEDSQEDTQYNMLVTYDLDGKQDDNSLLQIKAKFRLIFTTQKAIPDGFFEVFREVSLGIITLPYFRELVSSMTGRMDLPKLTLPFNIFNAQLPEVKAANDSSS